MKVDISNIKQDNDALYYIVRDVTAIQADISETLCELEADVLNAKEIGYNLSKTNNSVIKEVQELRDLYVFVDESMDKYTSIEKELSRKASQL